MGVTEDTSNVCFVDIFELDVLRYIKVIGMRFFVKVSLTTCDHYIFRTCRPIYMTSRCTPAHKAPSNTHLINMLLVSPWIAYLVFGDGSCNIEVFMSLIQKIRLFSNLSADFSHE
jgi:hypothetical protein